MVAARLSRVPPFENGLTLGDFLVPIRLGERAAAWQRHVLMIVISTLLIIACARISFYLPGLPAVPVTLQTFAVIFTGALLGLRRSLVSVGLYLLLGIIGLPVFAFDAQTEAYGSGVSSIASLSGGHLVLGATGGYLLGFLLAGAVVGRLAELGWDRRIGGSIGAMLLGNIAVYLVGIPWLISALHKDLTWGLQNGLYPFVVGDTLKLLVAAGLLTVGWWLVQRRSSDR